MMYNDQLTYTLLYRIRQLNEYLAASKKTAGRIIPTGCCGQTSSVPSDKVSLLHLSLNHLSYFCRQISSGKGFLNEMDIFIQYASVGNDVCRITGHE